MIVKLTAKSARELPGPPGGRPYVIHYDAALPGFGLRVTKSGARSFVLNYMADGIERRITLGSIMPDLSAEALRALLTAMKDKASTIKGASKYDGRDVLAERKEQRDQPTVGDLCTRYQETHLLKKRPSSRRNDEQMIETIILPAMKNIRAVSVKFSDVDDLHRKVTKAGAPIRANRVVALLSKMFSLAIKWGMRTDNPAKGIERNPESRRKRYLMPDELKRLGVALSAHKKLGSANAIRLLLLTGARRGEVLGATWEQFDLDEGVWSKPAATTKQKAEHRVPLSGAARQLLVAMREAAEKRAKKLRVAPSPFLFPGEQGKPQGDLKKFWASVSAEAKIVGARIHDLRHTYASVLASAGQTLPVIGALLGHTSPITTNRYAHLFDDPLRQATERAASIITPGANRKSADVLQMGRKPRKAQ